MSTQHQVDHPTRLQYIAYCYWRALPDSMRDWVRHDLTGKGAVGRMIVRWAVPCVLVLAPTLFIPMSLYLHVSLTLPLIIPYVYFSVALNKIYRRARLIQHGLDPDLVDELAHQRDAHQRRAYEQRHGR